MPDPAGSVPPMQDESADEACAEAMLRVERRDASECQVVVVAGEIDALTADRLATVLEDASRDSHGRPLVVDLSAVTILAAAGLHVLVAAARRGKDTAMPLRMVADSTQVLRPIKIAGLDEITLHRSLDEALNDPPEAR
jgi:anti-sigma B factor antagonist